MKAIDQRHRGTFSYKTDPKYRVSIPASWRSEMSVVFLLEGKDYGAKLVKVLTEEAYNERVERIELSEKTPAEKVRLLEALAALCREAVINEQGKLLIPKDLSERVGIGAESSVVLVGCGGHFQIMNPESFDIVYGEMSKLIEDDDLGIF